jgi:hypothetical protein
MKYSLLKLKDLSQIKAWKSDLGVMCCIPIYQKIDQFLTDTQPYVNRIPCE